MRLMVACRGESEVIEDALRRVTLVPLLAIAPALEKRGIAS
jgi:hypothetical protein